MNNSRTAGLLVLLWILTPSALAAVPENADRIVNATSGQFFYVTLNADTGSDEVSLNDPIDLLVNGLDTGLHPLGYDPMKRELTFRMIKDAGLSSPTIDAAWQVLLGHPFDTLRTEFIRELRYVALEGTGNSAEKRVISSGRLKLRLASSGLALTGAGMVIVLWGALIYLGRKSSMLRDSGNSSRALEERTYSLGRVQMAWWFAIIIGAYIFLWVMTGSVPSLGSQALLLMGVSGITGMVSAGLDASRNIMLPASSGKFLDDLLTDEQGVTLHRFQMLAMTLIMGVMFLFHVIVNLSMPEFDGSLIALMGIAGGTYVGFKIPEKQGPAAQTDIVKPSITDASEETKAGYAPEAEPRPDS